MSPHTIDFILSLSGSETAVMETIMTIRRSPLLERLILVTDKDGMKAAERYQDDHTVILSTDAPFSSKFLRTVTSRLKGRYVAVYLSPHALSLGYRCLERMVQAAEAASARLLYSDRTDENGPHPVIDYQVGSLRDDFDFGSLKLYRTDSLRDFVASPYIRRYRHAAWYALRLFISHITLPFHLREVLYKEVETDLRSSGEKQFDYVKASAREVQQEMERAVTDHLKHIGAYLAPDEWDNLPKDECVYPVEASVIIPVRNRVRTIADAVESALTQQAPFPFNVIVVDNHSDDGTSEILDDLVRRDPRVVRLVPERDDLGIGGCWDLAIRDEHCGRYAVQLDSDDLYSGPDTLVRIVEAFHREGAAMVIGSYRMVDFQLQTLPPGLIAHTEWTPENGRNNALRINGLGAPRAFRTDILRTIGMPNTSYGEDYALGLTISTRYRIERIYDELYLCRRWEGNSDAKLSVDKQNHNNLYKDLLRTLCLKTRREMIARWNGSVKEDEVKRFFDKQIAVWSEAAARFKALEEKVETRELEVGDCTLRVQYNPSRLSSTGAKVDRRSLTERPCFLCEHNRPEAQQSLPALGCVEFLVNPYPILPRHLTIPTRRHVPQRFQRFSRLMDSLVWAMPDFLLLYNGARSGASAPDHAHLQAGAKGYVPIEKDWKSYENHLERIFPACKEDEAELEDLGYNPNHGGIYLLKEYVCPAFVVLGPPAESNPLLLEKLLSAIPRQERQVEPDVNILSWRENGGPAATDYVVSVVFPRRKHRPSCYGFEADKMMISPGSIDMGGLIITPRAEDFQRLTARRVQSILREVTLTESEMAAIAKKLHGHKRANLTEEKPQKSLADLIEKDVTVGIMRSEKINFSLTGGFSAKGTQVTGLQTAFCQDGGIVWNNNLYSELTFTPLDQESTFTLSGVTIGRDFHWQQEQLQTFTGTLRLIVDEEKLVVINALPVEDYLTSVISSEMNALSPLELLKTHAVVSRSWVYSMMMRRREGAGRTAGHFSFVRGGDEFIRWHDRADHTLYDVCADDHCQRYQGITNASHPQVREAVEATRGEVLTSGGELCDARFSKCCGGVTELYATCWDDADYPYLQSVRCASEDNTPLPDLTKEDTAREWILSRPAASCHTHDKEILERVLNGYDLKTIDFYRWKVVYSAAKIRELIERHIGRSVGDILRFKVEGRGKSGRIFKLRVIGTEGQFVIGKELEIRRMLSDSHLLSSAFIITPEGKDPQSGLPETFRIQGAGWGHGVGMCQIGAAVMAEEGKNYKEILQHYYLHSEITRPH